MRIPLRSAPLPCALLALAALTSAPVLSQELCPGHLVHPGSSGPGSSGLGLSSFSIGLSGDRLAFPLTGPYDPAGADGGAAVYRIAPGSGDLVLEDSLVVPGLGTAFGSGIIGAAVASSGAVLVAKRELSPEPAQVVQLRRTVPGGPVTTTSMAATLPITFVEGNRRFDSDGDRAVISTWTGSGPRHIALDFFGVNAAGDWVHEGAVRSVRVPLEFSIFDVTLRGDKAVLCAGSGQERVFGFERSAAGRWSTAELPSALLSTNPHQAIWSGDRLVTTHFDGIGGRVDVHRRVSGSWSFEGSIPTGGDSAPRRPELGGGLIAFQVQGVDGTETWAYGSPSPGVFDREATIAAPVIRLGASVALVDMGVDRILVLERAELRGSVRACTESGQLICAGQRAGDLSHLRLAPLLLSGERELVLENAPARQWAILVGSTSQVPSAGALDSLCIGMGGQQIRLPQVQRIALDGTASWSLDPTALPLVGGGFWNGLGNQVAFQAVVRTYAGPASSRAVVAPL